MTALPTGRHDAGASQRTADFWGIATASQEPFERRVMRQSGLSGIPESFTKSGRWAVIDTA
ncbi:MAG: hypothetical protein P8Y47_09305, partial [Alphaproteobacteria bacterium]